MQPDNPHVISTNSDHEIEFEDPKIIIDSARRVVDAVRQGRSSVR
jgi:hypothetical protein